MWLRWILSQLWATLILTGALSPAAAVTAGDVMDRMEPRESHGFIGGAVDMASHLYALGGDIEKANCTNEWMFHSGDSALREIHAFFDTHKDRDAVAILAILIERHCGNGNESPD